jgi:hypothetical protein
MRQALKLLLLLGAGLLMAKPNGGDGPDGPDGDGGDVDPLTGRPKDSEERQERLNFQDKNASTEMAEVHDTAKTEAEAGRAGDSDSATDASGNDQPGGPLQTGGSTRPRESDYEGNERWSADAYAYFTQNDRDVDAIAENLSSYTNSDGSPMFTSEDILNAKNNVMRDEHLLYNYESDTHAPGRFDASPTIAAAWIRLVNGNPHPSDITLMQHEVAEASYFSSNPSATYPEAHQ